MNNATILNGAFFRHSITTSNWQHNLRRLTHFLVYAMLCCLGTGTLCTGALISP